MIIIQACILICGVEVQLHVQLQKAYKKNLIDWMFNLSLN